MRTKIPLLIFFLAGLILTSHAAAEDRASRGKSLGLIAGPAGSTETMLAADMANLLASHEQLKVTPMSGDGGLGNIAVLLEDPRVDVAFVSTEALSLAQAKTGGRLDDGLELVAKLYPQEVHVLARNDVASLADLVGRPVNFGPDGSSAALTAAALFEALGLAVEALHLDTATGLEQLQRGEIAAALIVGGKPNPAIGAIASSAAIRLLPVPFGAALQTTYLPTHLSHGDYPNLVEEGGDVTTVATGIALLAATGKGDPEAPARIARFVETVFSRFSELQAPGHHPKWQEINLAATVPGFRRTAAVEAWLSAHATAAAPVTPGPAIVSTGAPSASAESPTMSTDEKEALFERFMKWQRASRR
ncbi:MAG: TAXI family TRAP transporter solute-binding subunit [Methyloceanibacter sp.]